MRIRQRQHPRRGTATIEELVVLSTVALGFAAVLVAISVLLVGRHQEVEFVLSLPVP